MQADGYSLDDKRSPISNNDIPDIISRFSRRDQEHHHSRTEKSFLVPLAEIKGNDWDLSINRYKEVVYEQVAHESPTDIITQIERLDVERMQALHVLKELLG
jgi:type I restriction enzyme M protein